MSAPLTWQRWDAPRLAALTEMWSRGDSVAAIADALRTSRGAIYVRASKIGLNRRHRPERSSTSKPSGGPLHRLAKPRSRIEGGRGGRVLADNHPAVRDRRTLFPSTVVTAAQSPRLLVSGHNQRKLGAVVQKGAWKGMPIYALTLEERATCPTSCRQWLTCFGNNMHLARRHSLDGAFMDRLEDELAEAAQAHPGGFVVRLHVLGDFGPPEDQELALEYVALWLIALDRFPPLRVFGFTAHEPDRPVGRAIAAMNILHPMRCRIRFSGHVAGGLGAVVIEHPEDSRHVLCPAQTDATDCCATCALCWSMNRTVEFVRH